MPKLNDYRREPASLRIYALERQIAKLEARSQPLGKTCPQCHAFGLESYVLRTAFGGQGLQMVRCRFCEFAEEEMRASALPRQRVLPEPAHRLAAANAD